MTEYILSQRLYRRDWIFNSPISCVGFAFEDYLHEQGYRKGTIHFYLASIAHFAKWIASKKIELSEIDIDLCEKFIQSHLPQCSCPEPRQIQVANIRAALRHLRTVLNEQGVAVKTQSMTTPVLEELQKYHRYLKDIRGLADNTCQHRLKYIHQFLRRKFEDGPIDATLLTVRDIDEFILEFASRWKPSSLAVIRSALRSYLRYRALTGDRTDTLIAVMPVIAQQKGADPRKSLTDEQIRIFIESFDQTNATGLRNYAIARCLLDLGLRGHEVAQLCLDSIDWSNGTITIPNTKGRRTQVLPLPLQTGRAVARYLRRGRPDTSNRFLFVRHVAPWDKPITVCAIRNAMNYAYAKCGMDRLFCNTHVLRHTLATRLQRAGASIKEIADVLRHKDLESAAIYARTDLENLRSVGLPWPGRKS